MRIHSVIQFSVLIFLVLCTTNSLQAQENDPRQNFPSLSLQSGSEYFFGPGDILDIRVFKQQDLSGKFPISDKGTINFPLIGQIQASGLTEEQFQDVLRLNLLKYLQHPQISVAVAEYNSQKITVVGAIKSPGHYSLRRSERLLDIIFMAGGLSTGAGETINIVRYSKITNSTNEDTNEVTNIEPINIKDLMSGQQPELNFKILPGDLVNVRESDTIYVTGNVNKPGAYTGNSLTLLQAMVLAGGETLIAKNKISISRAAKGNLGREEILVNLSDVRKRKVNDPILKSNDVIYVPGSEAKNIALNTAKTSISSLVTNLLFLWLAR